MVNKIIRGIAAILGLIISLGIIGLLIFLFVKGWYNIIRGNAPEEQLAILSVITLFLVILVVLTGLSKIFKKNNTLKKIKDEFIDLIRWTPPPPI